MHHLELNASDLAGNGSLGRYLLLPGSADRAARIGRRLRDVRVHPNRRRLEVQLGRLEMDGVSLDVGAIATGMGCPSVDIVVGELLGSGARRLLRVGTAGSLQPDVHVGDVVIASGAVRDEGASDAYTDPRFPAVADPGWVEALQRAAIGLGIADRAHVGIVHSKDSFFGREFGKGPDGERNKAYMERLSGAGVVASEMEAAHLFVLGSVHGEGPRTVAALRSPLASVRCGAVLAIVGGPEHGFATLDEEQSAEERMIDLALRGVVELARLEGVV